MCEEHDDVPSEYEPMGSDGAVTADAAEAPEDLVDGSANPSQDHLQGIRKGGLLNLIPNNLR